MGIIPYLWVFFPFLKNYLLMQKMEQKRRLSACATTEILVDECSESLCSKLTYFHSFNLS